MNELAYLRHEVDKRLGQRDRMLQDKHKVTQNIIQLKKDLRRHEEAGEIIKKVGLKTQQQLQYNISDISSLALETIFPDPYELVAEFVERRNKTECDLYFERDGKKIHPLDAAGGGTVDVAASALRIASWSMERPRVRPILVLDEPFKYLSANFAERAGAMLNEVAKRLGLQIIMVTHSAPLAESASVRFITSIKKGVSHVRKDTDTRS